MLVHATHNYTHPYTHSYAHIHTQTGRDHFYLQVGDGKSEIICYLHICQEAEAKTFAGLALKSLLMRVTSNAPACPFQQVCVH